MIAFEVTINGNSVCTAGVGEYGYIATDILWSKCNPAFRPKGARKKDWDEELLYLRVSDLVAYDKHLRERLVWANKSLSAGDEIVIRVLEQAQCDEPQERVSYDKNEMSGTACAPRRKTKRKSRRQRT
jgi:hypothetical protein